MHGIVQVGVPGSVQTAEAFLVSPVERQPAGDQGLKRDLQQEELSDRFELVSETCAQPELTRNKVDATRRERRCGWL